MGSLKNLTFAGCEARPALFCARTRLAEYFERPAARPAFARVLDEARPHFPNYPLREALETGFQQGAA